MEYRGNFILGLFIDILWVALQIITVEIVFSFSDSIVGWTKPEVITLVGVFRVVKGVFDVLFRPNLLRLDETINRGQLDYILTLPVNSQFLISTRYHALDQLLSIISGLILIFYGLAQGEAVTSPLLAIYLIVAMALGVTTLYSIVFLLSTLSIFLTRMSALKAFYDVLSNSLRYPTDIYVRNSSLLSTIIIPFAIVVTIPSKLLLGKVGPGDLTIGLLVSATIFLLSRKFWSYSLRHYSSASS